MAPEKPPFKKDVTLRFVLDGVYYAVKQNWLTREQAAENLKDWFPEIEEIVDNVVEFPVSDDLPPKAA